jgi:hypothetical protein
MRLLIDEHAAEQFTGTRRRWCDSFRCHGSRRWSAVARLFSLVANSAMNTEPFPKCGATRRVRGKAYGGGTFADVRFKPDDSSLLGSKKRKKTTALVCPKCGFIELFLEDHND